MDIGTQFPLALGDFSLAQGIADAAHGVDEAGFAVLLQLGAQGADVDFQDVRLAVEILAPDAIHNQIAREHLPGIAQEEDEQVEFAGGQFDRVAAAPHIARAEVHGEIRELERFACD